MQRIGNRGTQTRWALADHSCFFRTDHGAGVLNLVIPLSQTCGPQFSSEIDLLSTPEKQLGSFTFLRRTCRVAADGDGVGSKSRQTPPAKAPILFAWLSTRVHHAAHAMRAAVADEGLRQHMKNLVATSFHLSDLRCIHPMCMNSRRSSP